MVGEHVCAPDLVHAVAGYKLLTVRKVSSGFELASPYHRTCVWEGREQTAKCLINEAWGLIFAAAKSMARAWDIPLLDDWRDPTPFAAELGLHPVPKSLFP